MKLSHVTVTLVAAMACLGSAACSKDKNADATTTAASVAATADKPAEKAAAAPAELPLDQFLTKAVPAACKTIAECKNDKMKVATTMPVMLIAGFGTIDKPELGNEVKAVNTSMKADKRFVPNEKECTTLGGVAMKVLGMQADALNGKVGKTIAYDASMVAQYADAVIAEDDRRQEFLRRVLMRPDFLPFLDAWRAEIRAGRTPNLTADQAYRDSVTKAYREAESRAEGLATSASAAGQVGDSYVLMTVLLAISLFFAGVTSSFRYPTVRTALLLACALAIAVAGSRIIDLPVAPDTWGLVP